MTEYSYARHHEAQLLRQAQARTLQARHAAMWAEIRRTSPRAVQEALAMNEGVG